MKTTRSLLAINKETGFDCQSCAWPSPEPGHRKAFEFCENGAKAVADELTNRRLGPDFFREHSIAELLERSDYWLNAQGRLTHPMVRRPGATRYEPISWDEAIRLVATELRALPSPDQAIFYTSGKTCNEPAFLFQLFARQLGTNNLPDCSNMCHESSGTALNESIGIGKGTATLEDLENTDLVIVIGTPRPRAPCSIVPSSPSTPRASKSSRPAFVRRRGTTSSPEAAWTARPSTLPWTSSGSLPPPFLRERHPRGESAGRSAPVRSSGRASRRGRGAPGR